LARLGDLLPIGALIAVLLVISAWWWAWWLGPVLSLAIAYVIGIGFSAAPVIWASTPAAPTPWTSRRLAWWGNLLPIGALIAVPTVYFALWGRDGDLVQIDLLIHDGLTFVLLYVVPTVVVIGIGFSAAAIIRARREAREGAGGPARAAPLIGIVVGFGCTAIAIWLAGTLLAQTGQERPVVMFAWWWGEQVGRGLSFAIPCCIAMGFSAAVTIRASSAEAPSRWTSPRLARFGYLLPIGALIAVLTVVFVWPSRGFGNLEALAFGLLYVLPISAVIGIGFSLAALIRSRLEASGGSESPTRAAPFVGIVVGLGTVVVVIWFFTAISSIKFGM
jgi:hypothetical protein